jgi:hypothetical protein
VARAYTEEQEWAEEQEEEEEEEEQVGRLAKLELPALGPHSSRRARAGHIYPRANGAA